MRNKYSKRLPEEATEENETTDLYCSVCGVYNEGILHTEGQHTCPPKVLHGIEGTENSRPEEPRIKKPSIGTLFSQGFAMLDNDSEPIRFSN